MLREPEMGSPFGVSKIDIMKPIILLIVNSFSTLTFLFSQEQIIINGAIEIGDTYSKPLPEGTIRWDGNEFIALTASGWTSLTGEKFIRDRENNKYRIVKIGDQVWMKDNLQATRYNNGQIIPLITDASQWSMLTSPAYTWYNNGGSDYGALYNYYTVADTNNNNICPSGWHVPTPDDWNVLITYLGGSSAAGGSMKESGLTHWAPPNAAGTNDSGFTGVPGGYRNILGGFVLKGQFGFWWSNKATSSADAIFFSLIYNDILINENILNKRHGMSVRCVKD